MTLTTPGLLFPAISLLLLAYTNRFLVLAQLIRELNAREGESIRPLVKAQIDNLRKRIRLIRRMQVWGLWPLCCVLLRCLPCLSMCHC